MRYILRFAVAGLVFVLAILVCLATSAKTSVAQPGEAVGPLIDPPNASCRTGRALLPASVRRDPFSWYLVVNFDAVQKTQEGQQVKYCLLVAKTDSETSRKVVVEGNCDVVSDAIGDVTIRQGVATFRGGYIKCDGINIGAAGELIGIPIKGDLKFTPSFWMSIAGTLSPVVTNTVPLIYYEPVTPTQSTPGTTGTVGLNVMPASPGQPEGIASTRSPAENLIGPGLSIAVKPATAFNGVFQARPDESTLVFDWSLNIRGTPKLINRLAVPTNEVILAINESTLYIGGTPKSKRFIGSLDGVVFDPPGGSRGGG